MATKISNSLFKIYFYSVVYIILFQLAKCHQMALLSVAMLEPAILSTILAAARGWLVPWVDATYIKKINTKHMLPGTVKCAWCVNYDSIQMGLYGIVKPLTTCGQRITIFFFFYDFIVASIASKFIIQKPPGMYEYQVLCLP